MTRYFDTSEYVSADLTHDEDTSLTFLACSEDGAAEAAAAEAAEAGLLLLGAELGVVPLAVGT